MTRDQPANAPRISPIGERGAGHYQLFILSSLALAGLSGFVLGIHVAAGRLLGWQSEARRPDLVQVHGQVQLLGFAGLFVLGMSLRLMPRFAASHLKFEGLVLPAWLLITGALVTRAFVLVWLPSRWESSLVIGAQFALLLGATAYLLVSLGTLVIDQDRLEGSGLFFLVGAGFFFLQAALGTLIAIQEAAADSRVFSYLPNMALLYTQIGGFLLAFVGGVATRAIPTMSGLPRPESGAKKAALSLAASVMLLSVPLLWLEYAGYSDGLARVSDAGLMGLGFSLLAIVWLSGSFRPAANRVRPASQPHMRLVKLAFGWFLFAGVLAVYWGAKALAEGGLPAFAHLDALRHALVVGGVMTLIFGMAMMIVPEFAAERQRAHDQARIASVLGVLLFLAAAFRVLPGLLDTGMSADTRNSLFLTAGLLGEAAVLYFAWRFVRLWRRGPSFAPSGSQIPLTAVSRPGPD